MKLLVVVVLAAIGYNFVGFWAVAVGLVVLLACLPGAWEITPPPPVNGSGSLADAGGHAEGSDSLLRVRARLLLFYGDAAGQATEREVNVFGYDPDGGSIEAFCQLRKENRTFRLDRIQRAIDLDTGEELPVTRLRSWLRKRRAKL
ncbi:WYL domain-containing protein [Chromobacterium violaceum]|uniref:WYL domain-containing protein n=1 Tax=Chromobacterium violaceum TaxID=536 RepID=UPI001CE0C2B8|nr:WYL domain-containing protein [Chromobacterium violaceum]